MALSDDLRKQVLIELRANGEGVADRAALEIRRLKDEIAALSNSFADEKTEADEFRSGITSLTNELKFWVSTQKTANEAVKEAAPGFAEYQAAIESTLIPLEKLQLAGIKLGDSLRQTKEAAEAKAELDRYRATLRAMANDTEAATEAEIKRREGLRQGLAAAKEVADAVAAEVAAEKERRDALESTLVPLQKVQLASAEFIDTLRRVREEKDASKEQDEAENRRLLQMMEDERNFAKFMEGIRKAKADSDQKLKADLAELQEGYFQLLQAEERETRATKERTDAANQALQGMVLTTQEVVKDTRAFSEYSSAIKTTAREYDRLNDVLREGAAMEANASRATEKDLDAARMRRMAEGYNQASESQVRYARTTDEASQKTSESGRMILNWAHAMQDAQYGFGAVLNNIPLLIPDPKAAGAVMALGIAYEFLKGSVTSTLNEMDAFGSRVDTTKDRVESLGKTIQDLEKKPVKMAVDVLELENARREVDEIKAALKAVDDLRKTRSHYEKESGQEIAGMFAEAPGGGAAVRDKLRNQLVNEQIEASGPLKDARAAQIEAQKDVESLKRMREFASSADELAEINRQLLPALAKLSNARNAAQTATTNITKEGGSADVELGRILEGAQKGSGAAQAKDQAELARRLELAGLGTRGPKGTGLAAGVEAASPESLREIESSESDLDASIEEMKAARKRREDRAKAAKKAKAEQDRIEATNQREHDALVNENATRFGSEFGGAKGFLESDITKRIAQGQSNVDISRGITPDLRGRLSAGGVGKDIVDEVAEKILSAAVTKARSAALARNADVGAGAKTIIAEAGEKAGRQEQTETKRAAAQQRTAFQTRIAEGMRHDYGVTPQQAEMMAPGIERNIKRGMNPVMAGQVAMTQLQHMLASQAGVVDQMQANQEAMLGVIGPAVQRIGAQRARNARIQQGIGMVARGAANGFFPTFQPQ